MTSSRPRDRRAKRVPRLLDPPIRAINRPATYGCRVGPVHLVTRDSGDNASPVRPVQVAARPTRKDQLAAGRPRIACSACRAPTLVAALVRAVLTASPAGRFVPADLPSEGNGRAAVWLAALGCDLSPVLVNFLRPRSGVATLKGRRSAGAVIACSGAKRW
jgi:hypothetical protein